MCTSDTHFVKWPAIPDGDVLIIAGDILSYGTAAEFYPTVDTIAALPHRHKVLVAGNHDIFIEKSPTECIGHLADRGITYVGFPTDPLYVLPNGMTLLGLPFVTDLEYWAFNRREFFIDRYLDEQPAVDIVVSHSPPYGILDGEHMQSIAGRANYEHYGIKAYNKYAERAKPKLWICGHVHEGYGTMKKGGTTYYNVAQCDRRYKQVQPAVIVGI